MNVAIGTQIYLPYTQSWIYRQMKGSRENIALVICNEKDNLSEYPFPAIVLVPPRRLWIRKVAYKWKFILKHLPFCVWRKKRERYTQALVEHHIDLAHIHFGVMGVEFMNVCHALKIPLLVTFHGFDITSAVQRNPSYHRALLKLFDRMKIGIAVSHEMKRRLIQMGCAADKIEVSYLGIPTNEFKMVDRSQHQGSVRFLHAGRFSSTKGVPDLIHSFSKEFHTQDEVELYIAGDGSELPMVLQAIERSAVKEKIIFLGKLNAKEMKEWLIKCDVFVLNSRTPSSGDKEGLPIALLEASCTGLPIISTKHSGIPEGVLDEETGLLVEEYDNENLAKSMRRMMDKNSRLTMGAKGRAWMEEQFDLEKCSSVLDQVYHKAMLAKN